MFISIFVLISSALSSIGAPREYYELRTYRFRDANQEQRTETYLRNALIPALHRLGIKNVGVFKPLETDSTYGKKLVVLIPFRSLNEFDNLFDNLSKDGQYLADGKEYIDAPYNNPPYQRFESAVLKAFSGMPESAVPDLKAPQRERIYELRSYEGPTEKIYRNKVKMFNDGDEIGLFKRLGFNAVFYAETIAGSTMPNLVYMTTFENQTSRDAHWKAFGDDPQWKKLLAMPEYQHNVSKNVTTFFRPASYSDF
jgi:hypothetical protein